MTLVLEDHDRHDPQDTCVDPSPYTVDDDWRAGFEFAGGVR